MRLNTFIIGAILTVFTPCTLLAQPLMHFLYTGSDDLSQFATMIKRDDIQGVQVVYNWKSLEKAFDEYDFSQIEQDLTYLNGLNKKLFIQIQDRFFSIDAKNVPAYLLTDPAFNGGLAAQYDNPGENKPIGYGWVAQQWNPNVQARYQKLLAALADTFDGRIYGINLPETAIDPDAKKDRTGFSCDGYFNAEIQNIQFARAAFKNSYVVQFVNFWPCEWNNDRQYMSRLFELAKQYKIGLGGPDVVPYKAGQMKNAYPFFNQYKGQLELVAFAIQEPTLTYTNPKTEQPFTRAEFIDFAENYLGANIIFWSISSPWLNQP